VVTRGTVGLFRNAYQARWTVLSAPTAISGSYWLALTVSSLTVVRSPPGPAQVVGKPHEQVEVAAEPLDGVLHVGVGVPGHVQVWGDECDRSGSGSLVTWTAAAVLGGPG